MFSCRLIAVGLFCAGSAPWKDLCSVSAESSKIELNDEPDLRAAAVGRFILGVVKETYLSCQLKLLIRFQTIRFIERFPQILFGSLVFSNNASEELCLTRCGAEASCSAGTGFDRISVVIRLIVSLQSCVRSVKTHRADKPAEFFWCLEFISKNRMSFSFSNDQ